MAKRVMFICTGNICRSPIAEAVARDIFGDIPLQFGSSGLTPVPGHGASQGSLEFARGLGLSLDGHQSRAVPEPEFGETVWVIGMTRSHAAIFKSRHQAAYSGAIGVLGAPGMDLRSLVHSPPVEEVDDPYGMSLEKYQTTGRQIQRLLEAWRPVFAEIK